MSDHWGTPDSIFEILERAGFSPRDWYDPCPFKGVSGLESFNEWETMNWVNPPFSEPAPWIRRAFDERTKNGKITAMVLPAYTDRKWWLNVLQPMLVNHPLEVQVVHIGRHKFIPLDGQKESSPRFGSCLVLFGFSCNYAKLLASFVEKNDKPARNNSKAKTSNKPTE